MTQTQDRPGHGDFATDTRVVEWARPGQGDFDRLLAADGLEQLQMMVSRRRCPGRRSWTPSA